MSISNNEFINRLKNNYPDIMCLSEYLGMNTPVVFKCSCGNIWENTPNKVFKTNGCLRCNREQRFYEKFQKIKHSDNILIISKISLRNNFIRCKCKVCNYEWDTEIKVLIRGTGCPVCSHKQLILGYDDLCHTRPDMSKYLYNSTEGEHVCQYSKNKLKWVCPQCGEVFHQRVDNVVNQGISCPCCSNGRSKPEKMMMEVLRQLNIKFTYQKKFKWAKDYIYDFYIEHKNSHILLEVDGGFHIKETKFKKLTEIKHGDAEKESLATKNNMIFIRIPCYKSTSKCLEQNICNSTLLNNLFNFSNINWRMVEEKSTTSLMKESWNL